MADVHLVCLLNLHINYLTTEIEIVRPLFRKSVICVRQMQSLRFVATYAQYAETSVECSW